MEVFLGGGGSVIETRALAKANKLNERYTNAKLKLAQNAKIKTDEYLKNLELIIQNTKEYLVN